MTDPREKPPTAPTTEGGVKTPDKTPPEETAMVEEGAPQSREPSREGGMIGEG